MSWQPTQTAPEGVPVQTRIYDEHGERNLATLVRRGRLWFSGEMYVYYSPTHWRTPTPENTP